MKLEGKRSESPEKTVGSLSLPKQDSCPKRTGLIYKEVRTLQKKLCQIKWMQDISFH